MKLPFPENGHEWTHSALTCFFPTSLQSLHDHVLPVQDVAQNKLGSLQRKPCTNFVAVQQVQRPLKLVFPGALPALSALSEVLIQTMRLPQRSSQGKQEKNKKKQEMQIPTVVQFWTLDGLTTFDHEICHICTWLCCTTEWCPDLSQEWDSPGPLFHPGESTVAFCY